MGLDIVEIGLDSLTDHAGFEKMASEIMRDEGYPNIKPLGGVGDSGRDAVQETYGLNNTGQIITVFQYTLQDYLPGKIKDTVAKLRKANIEFNELVIVTPHAISTERQDQMKREARNNFGIVLGIFDRKTIVNRLADMGNGIFVRHFPDVEKQAQVLSSTRAALTLDGNDVTEAAMLRASLLFTFGKDSPRVRDSVFDSLTFAVISRAGPTSVLMADLHRMYEELTGLRIPVSQLSASVNRLSIRGLTAVREQRVSLTPVARQHEAAITVKANEATESLIADVIQNISVVIGKPLENATVEIVKGNTRSVLTTLFRLFGTELANRYLKKESITVDYFTLSDELITAARSRLPLDFGNLLVSVIGQIIRKPSEEQAETLCYWSLSYLGVQIMHVDPTLREFQSTRFSSKMFILDTDFILDCIVKEGPLSAVYLELIAALKKSGSRVIIPASCLDECVTHAMISPRTYNYFGAKLTAMMDSVVEESVWNVFVKGYYYGRTRGMVSSATTFLDYLKNYYEPRSPRNYLNTVIKSVFPKGVEIVDVSTLLKEPIPPKTLKAMSDELFGMLSSAPKSQYRSTDDTKRLAVTDAGLFLTATFVNQGAEELREGILGGCCYLITSSSKYMRASNKIGLQDIVTTRPQMVASLLELIGGIKIDPQDFVRLFENPLLIHAVQQVWDDVEALLDSGIYLRDKSLPRLGWDLNQELHKRITALKETEEAAASNEEVASAVAAGKDFIELLVSASKRGYNSVPEVERLIEILEAKDVSARKKDLAYDELLARIAKLEEEITRFGKRKQRYLRRIVQQ